MKGDEAGKPPPSRWVKVERKGKTRFRLIGKGKWSKRKKVGRPRKMRFYKRALEGLEEVVRGWFGGR